MNQISDFTETEQWLVKSTLKERYGKEVPVDLVDTEIRLNPGARELTSCPALYWEERGAHFVVVKAGESRYRPQFYYRVYQMYGTGIEEYDDLGDCVVSILQVQADHERQESQETS